jgi:putative transposase
MSQSFAKIILHIVFSTKQRVSMIKPDIESELYAYLAGLCKKQECPAYKIGGTEDHVHICCALARTVAVSDLVEEIKAHSSKWIKTRDPKYRHFFWQTGYGVFSLGQSQLATVTRYITNQKGHHSRSTFQEEYLTLLKKYQIPYDERYVWE